MFSSSCARSYNFTEQTIAANLNCQSYFTIRLFLYRHHVEETSASSSQAHLYRQTNDLQTVPFSSLLLQSFHKACRT